MLQDEKYCGMKHAPFQTATGERHALSFGQQKINLHVSGREWEPKAQIVQPGSGDLCFLVADDIDQVHNALMSDGMEILEGGLVVERTGAGNKSFLIHAGR